MDKTIREAIKENSGILFALNEAGIKNIQTALDYMAIYQLNETLSYISSKTDRKNKIAEHLVVSKRTVESALSTMSKKIKIKNASV